MLYIQMNIQLNQKHINQIRHSKKNQNVGNDYLVFHQHTNTNFKNNNYYYYE